MLDLGQVQFSALGEGSGSRLPKEQLGQKPSPRRLLLKELQGTTAAVELPRKHKTKEKSSRETEKLVPLSEKLRTYAQPPAAARAVSHRSRWSGNTDYDYDDQDGKILTGREDVSPQMNQFERSDAAVDRGMLQAKMWLRSGSEAKPSWLSMPPPVTTTHKEVLKEGNGVIESATGVGDGKVAQTGETTSAAGQDMDCHEQTPISRIPDTLATAGVQSTSLSQKMKIMSIPPQYMNAVSVAQQEDLKAREAANQERTSDVEDIELQQGKDRWMVLDKFLEESTRDNLLNATPSFYADSVSEKVEERLRLADTYLPRLLRAHKSTRDVINGLHHANSSLQSTQPIFKHILEYADASRILLPLVKKRQADESFANGHAWLEKATAGLRLLADEIIRYCVCNIDDPGPCGESPVHLAFLLGMTDLGKDV
jgi:hypothetical protein